MKILWKFDFLSIVSLISTILGPLLVIAGHALITLVAFTFFTITLGYLELGFTALLFLRLLGIYLLIMIFFNYIMCVFTDAGTPERVGQPSEDTHAILMQESSTPIRTCHKCGLSKPERAHHCSICKKCVMKMDHHCPWMNNCVGHGNHRYFYLFLVYLSISCFAFVSLSANLAYRRYYLQTIDKIFEEYPMSQVYFLFSFMISFSVGIAVFGMAVWHTYLISTGQTTIEYHINESRRESAKFTGEDAVNQYDLGTRRNLVEFFSLDERRGWWSVLVPQTYAPKAYFVSLNDMFRE